MKVSLEDIKKAREVIKEIIRPTELECSVGASKLMGSEVYFKFENTQLTGSFKIRGAFNKINSLTAEQRARGVVASSAGNHAQGVAHSASLSKVKSTIVMPIDAPLVKVTATRGYGAEVILHGAIYDEAYEHARELEKNHGYVFVHPYEDEKIIAGQGTIGLEVIEKIPDLDSIIVPIGGGGLISGIATAVKAINPKCKVFGVQSEQVPGMERLFHKKPLVDVPKKISTIADGIAVKKTSKVMFDTFISKLVDDIVVVSDDELAESIFFLLERAKSVVEGSGAAGLAALFGRKLPAVGKKTCVLLCGGNIDLNLISKIIEKGQISKGRLAEMSVVVTDLPGSLSRLTQAIAEQRANILEVHHDRVSKGLYLRETKIDFVLETTSPEHIQKIREALMKCGARIL
jgi:threonine dehydratase